MGDKKIIILAVILSLLLIGGGWYYSKNRPQKAAISQNIGSSTPTPSGEVKITETGILYGNPDAPVTMEEYTNLLCSACGHFATETLPKINDNYIKTGKVKMIFYIFPPIELSQASLCAQEQNKFIEFHDYVFAHQTEVTSENDIKNFAINAGLNTDQFNACYSSNKYNDKAMKWLEQGQARGVQATPTFFINGQKFVGAQPFTEFQKIIDQKLAQQ